MSEVDALADAIEGANAAIVEAVRRAGHTSAWLRPVGDDDRRTAATLAHHIGIGYESGLTWAESIRESRRMPELSEAAINAANAEHAIEFAAPTPEAVEQLLQADCALLTEFVRSLADIDLGLTSANIVFGRQWSIRDVLETTIRHTSRHTEQFQQATSL